MSREKKMTVGLNKSRKKEKKRKELSLGWDMSLERVALKSGIR